MWLAQSRWIRGRGIKGSQCFFLAGTLAVEEGRGRALRRPAGVGEAGKRLSVHRGVDWWSQLGGRRLMASSPSAPVAASSGSIPATEGGIGTGDWWRRDRGRRGRQWCGKNAEGGLLFIAERGAPRAWPADRDGGARGVRRHGRGQGAAHCVTADARMTTEQGRKDGTGQHAYDVCRCRGGRRRRAR